MSLGILLVDEVYVIGADEFDAILMSQFDEHLVGLLLQGERLTVSALRRILHLVALQLQVVVIAEDALVPLYGTACTFDVAVQDLTRDLAGNTRRTDNQALVVALQLSMIGTRTHIVAVHPGVGDQLYQVLIALVVLSQHNEVVATLVLATVFLLLRPILGHIHLTAKDRLERFKSFLLSLFIHADTVVVKLLDAEHITMVGDGHAFHSISYRLVDKLRNL